MLTRLKQWLFGTGVPDAIITPETGSEDIYTMDLSDLIARIVDGEPRRNYDETDDEDDVANFDLEQEELD